MNFLKKNMEEIKKDIGKEKLLLFNKIYIDRSSSETLKLSLRYITRFAQGTIPQETLKENMTNVLYAISARYPFSRYTQVFCIDFFIIFFQGNELCGSLFALVLH